jgi:transcription elongation GreA/GreB family factor
MSNRTVNQVVKTTALSQAHISAATPMGTTLLGNEPGATVLHFTDGYRNMDRMLS